MSQLRKSSESRAVFLIRSFSDTQDPCRCAARRAQDKILHHLWHSAATTSGSQSEEGTQELRKRKSTHFLSSFPELLSSFFRIGYVFGRYFRLESRRFLTW